MIKKESEAEIEIRHKMHGGHGTIKIKHYFFKEDFRVNIRLFGKVILPPGASIGVHVHDFEDEIYYIICGTGILDDGSKKVNVTTGDAILTGQGTSHSLMNDGKDNLEFIAITAVYPSMETSQKSSF